MFRFLRGLSPFRIGVLHGFNHDWGFDAAREHSVRFGGNADDADVAELGSLGAAVEKSGADVGYVSGGPCACIAHRDNCSDYLGIAADVNDSSDYCTGENIAFTGDGVGVSEVDVEMRRKDGCLIEAGFVVEGC